MRGGRVVQKLLKIVSKSKKRVGRGIGSGKGGHTVGRGQKGQKARGNLGILFEGIKMKKSFVKKLPLRRGRGKFGPKAKPIVINLEDLNFIPAGTKVDLAFLVKAGIVDENDARVFGVKILGGGKLTKKITIALPISKSAAKKIEKFGGKVMTENPKSKLLISKST